MMKDHMDNQLRAVETDEYDPEGIFDERTLFRTNIQNASAKLLKYRLKLTSPVYYAAVVLIPWMRWDYFEEHLAADELAIARTAVQKLWEEQYKSTDVSTAPISQTSPPAPTTTKSSLLADHMRRSRSSKTPIKDEYQRYCARDDDVEHPDGHLAWWDLHQSEYPKLAQMARNIFSIPGMSAEVERLFSSAKLMLPPSRNSLQMDQIEAGECIRSWVRNSLIYGEYFEYLLPGARKGEHFRGRSVDNPLDNPMDIHG